MTADGEPAPDPPAKKSGATATIVVGVLLTGLIVVLFLILRTCQEITHDVGEGVTDDLKKGAVKTLDELSSHPIK
jgi:hypothetical protein